MTAMLKDVIEIPTRAGADDYVLRLTDSVEGDAVRRTLDAYVVTEELQDSFDAALGLVADAQAGGQSKGAFLTGSFGSGKSHFMAVLHALLRHDPLARGKVELQPVIARHDDQLRDRKILPLAFHMLEAQSFEQAIFSGYLRQISTLHPGSLLPALHRSDGLLIDAAQLRARMGDEAFFATLNGGGEEDHWSTWMDETWDAAGYAQAEAAAPGTQTRQKLVTTLVERIFTAYKGSQDFVDLDSGLAVLASHAKSLGYDAVVLFLDELVLWLAFLVQERDRFGREAQKLTKLVESTSGRREIPLVSFIARQMDLRKWFAESGASGREQALLEQGFAFQEGRFSTIPLGDDNLPYVASKRLLQPRDEAAARVLDDAFRHLERRPEVWDVLLDGMNTDDEHRGSSEAAFRLTYPFSPALMSTLTSLASVMQRERTALKVMQQMLVDQRDTLSVDSVIPVGDAYDYIVRGNVGQALDLQAANLFRMANSLYAEKLRPVILAHHGLVPEDLDRLAELPAPYRADDRLAKTLLLSAVAPKVPALKALTASRLASLNHGSIRTPLPGTEAALVLANVRRWAQQVPEVHVDGESANAVIRLELGDVDYESIVEKAKGIDSESKQRELVTELIAEDIAKDIAEGIRFTLDRPDMSGMHLYDGLIWRGSRRKVEVVFGNVRDSSWLQDSHFRPLDPGSWRLIIDHPFDTAGHSSAEDLQRLDRLREQSADPAHTLAWIPHFLSKEKHRELRRLVVLTWLLSGETDRWTRHADHLSEADRVQARARLSSNRDALRSGIREALKQAYGITGALPGTLLDGGRSDRLITSLDPVYSVEHPHGVGFKTAFTDLVNGAYDATYPDHPRFEPENEPVQRGELRQVLQHLVRAMDDPDRRVLLEGDKRAVRRVANVLGTGQASETHFVFGDDRFGTWGTELEAALARAGHGPNDPVQARELRAAIDALVPARGLLSEVSDIVILAWGLLRQRVWYRYGGALGRIPEPGTITPEMELRTQEMPTTQEWKAAHAAASSVLGLAVSPHLTPTTLAALADQAAATANNLLPHAAALVGALDCVPPDVLGPGPSTRRATAERAAALVRAVSRQGGLPLVRYLASDDFGTGPDALGSSLKAAGPVITALQQADWAGAQALVAAAPTDTSARRLLGRLRDALTGDEFQVQLAPVLQESRTAILAWALDARGHRHDPPGPTTPASAPADPSLTNADDVPVTLPPQASRQAVIVARGSGADETVEALRVFLREHREEAVHVQWWTQ